MCKSLTGTGKDEAGHGVTTDRMHAREPCRVELTQRLFGAASIGPGSWLRILAVAAAGFLVVEIQKRLEARTPAARPVA